MNDELIAKIEQISRDISEIKAVFFGNDKKNTSYSGELNLMLNKCPDNRAN